GSGLTLISQLARSEPRIEAIIAVSGDDTRAAAAMEAGADIFLAKPLSSISAFLSTVLGLLPAGSRPQRLARPLEDDVAPDPIALKNDLSLAAELLASAVDAETIIYLTGFLSSLARDADDTALEEIAGRVAEIDPGDGGAARQGRVAAMIRARIDTLDGI
ncbi:MAG: response regulator, partial [Silicimonas sp.]|nr:response regulator [Silicimonas sp.]